MRSAQGEHGRPARAGLPRERSDSCGFGFATLGLSSLKEARRNHSRKTNDSPVFWLLAPSPQQGINLPDGTLVMPMEGRDAKGEEFSTIMTSQLPAEKWRGHLGDPSIAPARSQ